MKKPKKVKVLAKVEEYEVEGFRLLGYQLSGLRWMIGQIEKEKKEIWERLRKKYKFKDGNFRLNHDTREITKES